MQNPLKLSKKSRDESNVSDYDIIEIQPLTKGHRRLNRNSKIVRNTPWLQSLVRDALIGRNDFRVNQMREKTSNLSLTEWKSVLRSLGQSRQESPTEVNEFLDNAIEAFIVDESKLLLEETLKFCTHLSLENNPHLIEAITSKSMNLVRLFVGKNFSLRSALNDLPNFDADMDELQEIDRLEAESSPFYLLNMFEKDPLCDPVKRSFQLIALIQKLIPHMSTFAERLEKLQDNVEAFLVAFIKNINNSEKAKIFLNREDEIEDISLSRDQSTFFPRIHLGLTLNLKSFVSHDNCQKSIYDTIIDESWRNYRTPSKYCLPVIRQMILTPVFCLAFLFGRCCCAQDPQKRGFVNVLTRNLQAPINNFISHTVSYLVFVSLIIWNHSNPQDQAGIDITFFNVGLVIYAFSFWCLDIRLMYHLSRSVQSVTNCCKQVKNFFSNWSYNFRFVAHFMLLFGLVLESLGYVLEPYASARKEKFSACATDNAYTYEGYSVVLIGISCQGIGTVMILSYAIHFFRLHPTLGALYIGIRKCFSLIISFAFTYLILFGAFTIGLHSIMKYNVANCYSPKDNKCEAIHKQVQSTSLDLTFICLNETQGMAFCSNDCIQDWIKNSTKVNCADGTTLRPIAQTPAIQSILNILNSLPNMRNVFHSLNSTSKALFWAIFEPGNPDLVGCSEGVSRKVTLTLWGFYNVLVTIIMLNLLIALMSSTMEAIQSGKIVNWKFHWTQLWMEYCFKSIILPPPMNLLQLAQGICLCCQSSQELAPQHSTEEIEYTDLLDDLKEEYLKDFENSAMNDANKDDFDRLAKEQKLLGSKIEEILSFIRKA